MGKKEAFTNLLYILLFISTGYFATDIYLPSLPAITKYFNTSISLVQLSLFSYLLSFSFTPLVSGPLSDHYGRKTIVLIGMIITVLSSVGCYFSGSIYALILFRFIQGIGSGAVVVVGRSILTDSFSGRDLAKKITTVTISMPIFLALAPTIGGYLQEDFGWQSAFFFLICYFFAILCATYLFKETLKKPTEHTTFKITGSYKSLLKNKTFMLYGLGYVIPSFGLFSYLAVSPFLFQNILGLSPIEYGRLALYIGSIIIIFSLVNTYLMKYFTLNVIILLGTFTILLAGTLLIIFHYLNISSFYPIFIPCLIYFICVPFSLANLMAKTLQQISRNFGSANALLSTMQLLGGTLSTLLFSFIKETSALPLGICFIVLAILTIIILFFAHKFEKINEL